MKNFVRLWNLIELNGGRKIIHKLTQYITERYEYWDRWIGGLKQTQIPTKILWAKNDPDCHSRNSKIIGLGNSKQ